MSVMASGSKQRRGKTQAPPAEQRLLSPQATRALAEAAARRVAEPITVPVETGGPRGPEPTRYGDWERKGRAVDF
jgi:hypothetical protein